MNPAPVLLPGVAIAGRWTPRAIGRQEAAGKEDQRVHRQDRDDNEREVQLVSFGASGCASDRRRTKLDGARGRRAIGRLTYSAMARSGRRTIPRGADQP